MSSTENCITHYHTVSSHYISWISSYRKERIQCLEGAEIHILTLFSFGRNEIVDAIELWFCYESEIMGMKLNRFLGDLPYNNSKPRSVTQCSCN